MNALSFAATDLETYSATGHLRYVVYITDDTIASIDRDVMAGICERFDQLTANGGGVFLSLWEDPDAVYRPLYKFYSRNFTSDPDYPSLAVNGDYDLVNWPNSTPVYDRYFFDKLRIRVRAGL